MSNLAISRPRLYADQHDCMCAVYFTEEYNKLIVNIEGNKKSNLHFRHNIILSVFAEPTNIVQ